jgi:hypothetical protein
MAAEVKRKWQIMTFFVILTSVKCKSNHEDKPKNDGFDKHGHNDNA